MATTSGKSPSFPPYTLSSNPVYRDLYILEGRNLYDKTGRSYHVEDYAGLVSFLHTHNAMAFVQSLSSPVVFPFLASSVQDGHSTVTCSKRGIPSSVICKKGASSRKIVSYRAWRNEGEVDTTFLTEMEELYRYCSVGSHGSPGALGYALQLQVYGANGFYHHYAPNRMSQKFLWKHHFGGRCDLLIQPYSKTKHIYDETIELDMSTAYGAHFQSHPTGTACPVNGEAAWNYATFFVECDVTIPHELALGPFPMRVGSRANRIDYPRSRGHYRSYLWREQIEDCQRAGCDVRCIRGYGWKHITTDNSAWAKYTYALRMGAASLRLEKDIKAAIVGGIGRHGMHNTFYRLVPVHRASPNDLCLADSVTHEPLPFFVHELHDYTKPAMTHWYGYTIMQTARSLYHYSKPYAEAGTLISTNYDALIIDSVEPPTGVVEKHTLASKMCEMGDLRWQRLTNVKIHRAREIECDQKVTRPGIKKERKIA